MRAFQLAKLASSSIKTDYQLSFSSVSQTVVDLLSHKVDLDFREIRSSLI